MHQQQGRLGEAVAGSVEAEGARDAIVAAQQRGARVTAGAA
jgi:hypothetical protein